MSKITVKYTLLVCIFTFWANSLFAQNYALQLDGKDNNVRTGIGFLEPPWTIEAWIKGNDIQWKPCEIVFGGGEYSTFKKSDNFPLVIKDGKLYSTKAGVHSHKLLDDNWHHVALSCNIDSLYLYMDGILEDKKDTSLTIIPGVLGASEVSETVFGGYIDEVRIWKSFLTQEEINKWNRVSISNKHPHFKELIAYYPFDSEIDDMAINWVGSGYHSYHIRNGRINYSGNLDLAFTSPSNNEYFKSYDGEQRLFNAISIESEWDSDIDAKDEQFSKLRIMVQGRLNSLKLESFDLDLSGTESLSDIDTIRIYYAGKLPKDTIRVPLATVLPKAKKTIVNLSPEKQIELSEGANYLLVTADISKNAKLGNKLCALIDKFVLNGKTYNSEIRKNNVKKCVSINSFNNSNVFRVLQWNIWHGGRHVPIRGYERIIELIGKSNADIVTMQEGYGFQAKIAEALNFNLQTSSSKDNLALFSRYSLIKQKTSDTFRSNPAIVILPGEKFLLVNDCWLSYSYRPDYTGSFSDIGHNTDVWVAEDSILPMANMRDIVLKDIDYSINNKDMPVIIGGDFNSCSHLDWTKRTAGLHAGYGPVNFPTSRLLMEKGYKDSFRVINPDELIRPEGTFAGIYGQLDFSRIDFIYYKGKHIRPISSKIIQTSPEIDDIWASDHSAVITTFIWEK